MTQFMDNLLVSLYKVVLEKDNKIVMKNCFFQSRGIIIRLKKDIFSRL